MLCVEIGKARTLTLLTTLALLAGPGLLLLMPSFLISRLRVLACCTGPAPTHEKLLRASGPFGNVPSTCKRKDSQS